MYGNCTLTDGVVLSGEAKQCLGRVLEVVLTHLGWTRGRQ